jgi:peroxiredoxin/outer membrane lipoprotein-sorting protein
MPCCRVAMGLLAAAAMLPLLAQEQDAGELLKKVAAAYTNLNQYQFEIRVVRNFGSPGHFMTPEESRIVLAASPPDRLRYEIRAPQNSQLTVSIGGTTWSYLPLYKQYTKEEVAAPDDDSEAGGDDDDTQDPVASARYRFVARFRSLGDDSVDSKLLREEEIEAGGEKIRCQVLEIAGERGGPGERLWIDPKRFLVLRSAVKTTSRMQRSVLSGTETTDWTPVRLRQEPDAALFAFQPPRGSKLVQVLDTPFKPADWSGRPGADFTLSSLTGQQVSLSGLRGKVVLMGFWASWCPPCRAELPVLFGLQKELRASGLVVLGINGESGNTARSYLDRQNLDLLTLSDSRHAVQKMYGVHGIPALFVLNRDGTVVRQFRGAASEDAIRSALKQAGLSAPRP